MPCIFVYFLSELLSIVACVNPLKPCDSNMLQSESIRPSFVQIMACHPDLCQAIVKKKASILLIGYLGTNFNEISMKIQQLLFKKILIWKCHLQNGWRCCHRINMSICADKYGKNNIADTPSVIWMQPDSIIYTIAPVDLIPILVWLWFY